MHATEVNVYVCVCVLHLRAASVLAWAGISRHRHAPCDKTLHLNASTTYLPRGGGGITKRRKQTASGVTHNSHITAARLAIRRLVSPRATLCGLVFFFLLQLSESGTHGEKMGERVKSLRDRTVAEQKPWASAAVPG